MYLCLCNVMRSQRHCSLCDCDAGFYPQSQQLCIQHVDTYTFCRTASCFSTNVLNMAHNSCIFHVFHVLMLNGTILSTGVRKRSVLTRRRAVWRRRFAGDCCDVGAVVLVKRSRRCSRRTSSKKTLAECATTNDDV